MAKKIQAIAQADLSGGENLVVSPFVAGSKQSLRVQGLVLDEHGSLRTVDGTLIQTTAPVAEAGNRIMLPVSWTVVGFPNSGVVQRYVTVRRGATNRLYNRTAAPWTLVGTFTGNQITPEAAIFVDLYIQTDDYNTPRKVDATQNFAVLGGGLPGARHLKLHQGFLWAFNTASLTTSTDGKSSLRSSDVNAPETWPAANQAFIARDDGQEGNGLGTFTIAEAGISPTAALVAFKEFSAFQVTGVFGAGGNLSIQKIKSDMGCVAPRTIQFVSGFGIIRLTHRGFALYDGVDDRLISEEIRPRLFGRDDIAALDWTNIAVAWAGQSQNPPIYFCLLPTSGTGMTLCVMYDLVRRAWTVVTFPFPLASANLILESGTTPSVLLTDAPAAGVSGSIRRWWAGDADFDGTAISWLWRTRPAFVGSHMRPAFFRRAIVDLLIRAGGTATYRFLLANRQAGSFTTAALGSTVLASGGVWDAGNWTPLVVSANSISLTEDQVPLDMLVRSPSAILELSGTGQARIRGIEWHAAPKGLRSSRF